MEKELETYLKENNITYKVHKHPPVFTVSESQKIKENIPATPTKSLFLKSDLGKFYLVCMYAHDRLNINSLRKKLNVKKLQFASKEELKNYLHVNPGSVSIFTMIYTESVHLILDKKLWDSKSVGFHPNINTSTLEVSHENLEKFYNSLNSKKEILNLDQKNDE